MHLFEEIERSLSKLERLLDTRELENFIARGYESAPYLYYTCGSLIDLRILNGDGKLYQLFLKGGIRYKEDMACMLLSLFYVYLWNKGESAR